MKIQIMANEKYYESGDDFEKDIDTLHRGDIVGVRGHPGLWNQSCNSRIFSETVRAKRFSAIHVNFVLYVN